MFVAACHCWGSGERDEEEEGGELFSDEKNDQKEGFLLRPFFCNSFFFCRM